MHQPKRSATNDCLLNLNIQVIAHYFGGNMLGFYLILTGLILIIAPQGC